MKGIATLCFLFMLSTGIMAQSPDFTGLKVMINPGHGGNDSDDRGMPNGFWESEGNLTKGLWLRDLLEARGCEVIMSRVQNRTEDDLALSVIAAMANDNNVDLFISIHSNAGNQVSNYPLTIFNGKSESPSIPEAKEWAIVLWEQLITNEATFWTNTNPKYIGDLTLNPTWSFGYGVLYPLEVPGIISEGSFHDYQPEMDRLLSIAYRKQEAWNMLLAMTTYFELAGSEPFGNISGIIRDSLLVKDNYTIADSPDKYLPVNKASVELLETGEVFIVDSLNTGFYMFDSIPAGTYKLVFSAEDYFNDTVTLEVTDHQFTYHNHWLEADKTMPPEIIGQDPAAGGLISCFDPVRITFNMNMDSATFADAFSITPASEGTFTWDEDYLNVWFQPDIPYETNTEYTVTIDNTAEHQWGVPLENPLNFSFTTGDRNRYLLNTSYPADAQTGVSPYLQFRLVFEAPLNNTSLIDAVKIFDAEGKSIGTRSATITSDNGQGQYFFSAAEDLSFGKSYTLGLSGSIQDEENIPMVDSTAISFTTMEEPSNIIIIDEFDENNGWQIDQAASSGIDGSSFLYRWTKTEISGEASTLLRYNFLSEGAICVLKPAAGPVSLTDNSSTIALWLWGEMSGNKLKAGFDGGEEIELGVIDFPGWNYLIADLPDEVTQLEYLALQNMPSGALTGDIYFDALNQQEDETGIHGLVGPDAISVYPNPLQGRKLSINNLGPGSYHFQVLSMDGRLLQKGGIKHQQPHIRLNNQVLNQHIFIIRIEGIETTRSMIIHNTNPL